MRFEMNVKTQPWAFTFLCQFGFCCLTLILPGEEIGCALLGELRWHGSIGQVRGWAPSQRRSCLKVYIWEDHARPGKSQAEKMSKLSEVPWRKVSVNPNRYKDLGVWLLLPFLAFLVSKFHFLKPPCLLNSCGFLFSPAPLLQVHTHLFCAWLC